MGDVADLMRDHAGEFVRRLGFVDETLEHVDAPARQGEGVGFVPAHHGGLSGKGKAAAASSWPMSLSNAARPGLFASLFPHSNAAPAWRVSMTRADLGVDRGAELALDRVGDQGREARGDLRHADDGNENKRHGRGDAPGDDLGPSRRSARPLRSTGIERSSMAAASCGSRTSSRASAGFPAFAEPQHAFRRRQRLDLAVGPFGEHRAVGGADRITVAPSSTVTSRRAVVMPSKNVPVPATVIARSYSRRHSRHRQGPRRPGSSPRRRRTPVRAQRDWKRRAISHDAAPEAELDGRLIDRRIAEHHRDIEADRGARSRRSRSDSEFEPCTSEADEQKPMMPTMAAGNREQQRIAEKAPVDAEHLTRCAGARSPPGRRSAAPRPTSARAWPGRSERGWRSTAASRGNVRPPIAAAPAEPVLDQPVQLLAPRRRPLRVAPVDRCRGSRRARRSAARSAEPTAGCRAERAARREPSKRPGKSPKKVWRILKRSRRDCANGIGKPERQHDQGPPEQRANGIAPGRAGLVEAHAAIDRARQPVAPRPVDRVMAEQGQQHEAEQARRFAERAAAQRQEEEQE